MKEVKSQKEFNDEYKNGERFFKIVGFIAVLSGNSRAVLWENSHAELRGNSRAELRENSRAVLWDFTVAHKLSKSAKIKNGPMAVVIIPEYPSDMKSWCRLKGIKIKNNRVQLWKCTNEHGNDFYTGKIDYTQKGEIVCPDWEEHYERECGYAFHLADSPQAAILFCRLDKRDKARLFKVSANINDCKCFGGNPDYPMKIRARACRVVREYPISDFI